MKYLKKETTSKKESIKIIIGIGLIALIIIGGFLVKEYASNHANTILHVGSITNYSIYGEYESTFRFIIAIQVIAYIIAGVLIIWTFLRLIFAKNSILVKLLILVSNSLLVVAIAISPYLIEPIILNLKSISIEPCWCGENYFQVEYR